jgi:hypothetical protein
MKDGGTCRGAGGSMHLYVSSQYACFIDKIEFKLRGSHLSPLFAFLIRTSNIGSKEVGH